MPHFEQNGRGSEHGCLDGMTEFLSADGETMSVECLLCHAGAIIPLFRGRDRVHGLPGDFALLRYGECGAIFYEPRLAPEALASYYPDSYGPYRHSRSLDRKGLRGLRRAVFEHYYGYPLRDGARSAWPLKWAARCLSLFAARGAIPFRGEGNFLDIGCGGGSYLYRLREWGWKVYGVEPSPAGAAQARSLGLDVHLGSLADAKYPAGFFDVVRLHHVLEHLPDLRESFVEIRRVLKPDGIVRITVPNTRSLNFWLFGPDWYGLEVPRYVISYCPDALRYLCGVTGFAVAEIRYQSGAFNFVRSVHFFLQENGEHWAAWVRGIDWPRNKLIRRALKPVFFLVDLLRIGDVMVAIL